MVHFQTNTDNSNDISHRFNFCITFYVNRHPTNIIAEYELNEYNQHSLSECIYNMATFLCLVSVYNLQSQCSTEISGTSLKVKKSSEMI